MPIHRRPGLHRLVLAALACTVLWLSFGNYRDWRRQLERFTALAETHGVADRRPGLIDGMRRDAGATRASLRLARAILADELDQRWIQELPAAVQAAERTSGLERLDVAHSLGLESLSHRPGSWEALLVIGGAEYLRLARRGDQRLLAEKTLWLAPLEEAHRLAPLQPEPLRMLAAADLGNWSVLSDDQKQHSIGRLEKAFRDPATFDLLSAAWLRVAPSLTQALAIVPERTWAWSGLMRYFARRGDWERYCDAQRKSTDVTRTFSSARLDEAENLLLWGDREEGLQRLLWVGAHTAPDGSNVALMERLLTIAPPGIGGEATNRWLRSWLDWSLAGCVRNATCPLARASLVRLIGLNRDLEPHQRAAALMIAGSLRDAEAIERRFLEAARGRLGQDWIAYMLGKSKQLTERGDTEEALALLSEVRLLGHDSVLYWLRHRDVARAAQDPHESTRAETRLATLADRRWTREDWSVQQRSSRLEVFPAEAAGGLTLRLQVGDSGQGVLELVWDGSVVEVLPATDGREIVLDIPIAVGQHLLEIRSEAGAAIATAEARLLPLAR